MKQKATIGVPLVLALVLSFRVSQVAGDTRETVDRFQLFADCGPMALVVGSSTDASKIGLTKEALQAAVESRLRSARLYRSEVLTPRLYVRVNVVGKAISYSLNYQKLLYDRLSGLSNMATTWRSSAAGTHGGEAGYILSAISQEMDEFLLKFLRVNEDACEKRFALPGSRKDE